MYAWPAGRTLHVSIAGKDLRRALRASRTSSLGKRSFRPLIRFPVPTIGTSGGDNRPVIFHRNLNVTASQVSLACPEALLRAAAVGLLPIRMLAGPPSCLSEASRRPRKLWTISSEALRSRRRSEIMQGRRLPMKNRPRAVIYARYSTDLQSDKSIEDQVAMCTAYAERSGLDVVATYVDRAVSGASLHRRVGMIELLD